MRTRGDRGVVLLPIHLAVLVFSLLHLLAVMNWPTVRETQAGKVLWCFYSHACHQLPQRSFTAGGESLPICARCVGVSCGIMLASLVAALRHGKANPRITRLGIGLVAFIVADWAAGVCGLVPEPWNFWRLMAGVAGGIGVYILSSRLILAVVAGNAEKARTKYAKLARAQQDLAASVEKQLR